MFEWICVLVIFGILRSMKPSSLWKLKPPSPRLIWLVMVIILVAKCGGVQLDDNGNNGDHNNVKETYILISVISLMSLSVFMILMMNSSYEGQVDTEEDDNTNEHDYLLNSDELESVEIELIDGNKPNSKWLVIEKAYVCHVNDKSCDSDVVYWECKRRRHDKCPFKCATQLDERGRHQLTYMYSLETHSCDQDKATVYKQIFRNRIKKQIATDQRAKYGKVQLLLKIYLDLFVQIYTNDPTHRQTHSHLEI